MNQPQPIPPKPQSNGQAVTALVTGICSLVLCNGFIGLPCAIVAINYAKKARRAVADGTAPETSLGMAKAGSVCGSIGVALNSFVLLIFLLYLLFLLLVMIGLVTISAAGAAGTPVLTP